jgi:dienelactone hydrolase
MLKPPLPEIRLTAPGATGERVVAPGLFANYFPAQTDRRSPGILMLGGSEGGIGRGITNMAVALQEAGFSVLTPAYFGAPGQPKNLELIPLETFDRAIEWLRARPEVDPHRIAIIGVSRGADAALLVAARHPEVRTVVAGAPSSVVWPGIRGRESFRAASSWTISGQPLPFLPYGPFRLSLLFGDIGSVYRGWLERLPEHPEAVIPVEKIKAPVLLVCGEDDTLRPACAMARQLKARAGAEDGPPIRILAYSQAGHGAFGLPLPRDDERLARWGGTPSGNNAARADSWPRIIEFLREMD